MEKKRSAGVTVCGIMMISYSLWLFIAAGITPVSYFFYRFLPTPFKMALKISAGLPLITLWISLIYLVPSIGILKLKNWARLFTVYFTILLLLPCIYVLAILTIFTIKGGLEGPAVIGYLPIFFVLPIMPFIIPLIYLTRPKVKEQFK